MTAHDAMETAQGSTIRSHVEGGLVSIAHAAEGYQLSFIPQMPDGSWNLAGTLSLGTFATIDAAAAAAWSQYAATDGNWEAAPENIVGKEPAESLVPSVEGHHIGQHDDLARRSPLHVPRTSAASATHPDPGRPAALELRHGRDASHS